MKYNPLPTRLFQIQNLMLCFSLCWNCIAFSKSPTKSICVKDPYLCKKARRFIHTAEILQDVDAKAAMRLLDYVVKRLPTSNPLHKKALRELKKLKKAHPNIKPSFKKFVYQTKNPKQASSTRKSAKRANLSSCFGLRISYKQRICRPLTKKECQTREKQMKKILHKRRHGYCSYQSEMCRR